MIWLFRILALLFLMLVLWKIFKHIKSDNSSKSCKERMLDEKKGRHD